MTPRSKKVAIKQRKISIIIKTYEIDVFNNMYNSLSPGSELASKKLMMNIKSDGSERFTVTIARDWKNSMELWASKKHKKHVSAVESHLKSWSCTPHEHIILTSFLGEEKIVSETK